MGFPKTRPRRGSFPRPLPGETLDVTPPGFCWWRAGARGKVRYRMKVMGKAGAAVYASKLLDDPVHVPAKALPAGRYTWAVEALDKNGKPLKPRTFIIQEGAVEQPWVSPKELLARVPREHPRLLFPKATLDEVRATLATTRKEAFASLKRQANRALKLGIPPEPDYDKIEDRAVRRLAYKDSFGRMRKYHQGGMLPLALMYMLTGERKYGEKAKALLLSAAEWDPEGISSVMAPHGDEIGLGLVRSGAQTYDWLYDMLTPAERRKVKAMLVARADQMLRRLTKKDYLFTPEESHNGRLPGYLVEHAIALAEEPRAEVWMDYAMRTFLTCFPHWAGKDGGWAEGIPYGLAYNTIYLMPFEALRAATGFDLWQRPFYRKVRAFFMYNISPLGDIMPWGDTEHMNVPGRSGNVCGLLMFHALRYNDPTMRWWVDQLRDKRGRTASVGWLPGLILPDTFSGDMNRKPRATRGDRSASPELLPPTDLPNDAAFTGVGWAVLHSAITKPKDDLMVMFKSSPYGPVSHSHADQNSFAIMKGGKGLAIPAGARWPSHGTPFHKKYVQQTIAHNAILVDGEGQINRRASANGRIVDFQTTPHLGYVCGDAKRAYGRRLKRCRRHVLLVRPWLVCVVDDLEAPKPVDFQWLMHAWDEMELDARGQKLVSRRGDAAMRVRLFTAGGFAFEQTGEWPMDPKEGFPKTRKKPPTKQWHFTASTRGPAAKRRIAAVMCVGDGGTLPACRVSKPSPDVLEVAAKMDDGSAVVRIDLSTMHVDERPILAVRFEPVAGDTETLSPR